MNDATKARVIRVMNAPPEQQAAIDSILDGQTAPRANDPLLVPISEGARLTSTSRTTIWRLIRSGVLTKVQVGSSGLYRLRRDDIVRLAKGK